MKNIIAVALFTLVAVSAHTDSKSNSFIQAVEANDITKVQMLIKTGANVNSRDAIYSETCLFYTYPSQRNY